MKIKTTQKCIKIAMTTVGHHTGVQISRDICCRFGRYLYSTKCSWIITLLISVADAYFEYFFFRVSLNSLRMDFDKFYTSLTVFFIPLTEFCWKQ